MATDLISVNLLPFETLQQISGHLDYTHRPSLCAFGLASKACRRATLPSLFRKIHLSIQSREALQSDVNALVTALSGTDSVRHVRRLSVKGFLIWNPDRISDQPDEEERKQRLLRAGGVLEVLGDDEPVVHGTFLQHEPVVVSQEEDTAWTPFVDLVKILPHLQELFYDCRNQFPPSLLDALHKFHPQCRLFHLQFRLRSLRWETPDAHEMAVATSPCLHSVAVSHVAWDSEGEFDYNFEATLELVAGLAPNLKEVRMLQRIASPTGQSIRRLALVERQPWRGLPHFVPRRSIGSLTCLSLIGAMSLGPDLFQAWSHHTDWSSLRHLVLGGGIECDHGVNDEALTWMLQNCSIVRLKTLSIRLQRDDDATERPNYTNIAARFFRTLEPLDELSVSGSLEPPTLDAILSQHGRSLKKFTLRPFESSARSGVRHIPMTCAKEHVLQIQAQCPLLQDLAIPVKRTKSDATEVDLYKSLGLFANVQNLLLILDCSDWHVARGLRNLTHDASFGEEDRRFYPHHEDGGGPLRRGHLREAFLNCAVDEALARSIWAVICQNKAGARLQSLKIYTTGGGSFGLNFCWPDVQAVVDHVSRSWLIERSVRDDEDWNFVNIRELGRRAREIRDEELQDEERYIYGESTAASRHSTAQPCTPGDIVRRIWPCSDVGKDWRDVWGSLPLKV
ncbi:unnamed protein product [Discula destructiva]